MRDTLVDLVLAVSFAVTVLAGLTLVGWLIQVRAPQPDEASPDPGTRPGIEAEDLPRPDDTVDYR